MGPARPATARRAARAAPPAAAPPATDADAIWNVQRQNARSLWVNTKSFFSEELHFKRRHFIIFILTQSVVFERSRSVGDTPLLLGTLCVLLYSVCFLLCTAS